MIRKKMAGIGNDALRRITSYASVFVAATLIAAKLYAYFETGSVALLSSLVDSGVDLLASVITACGVFFAMRPADHGHRFGHGKAESLAALAQAVFIVVSSGFLVKEAFARLIAPVPLENVEAGYFVMGLAIVMTAALLTLQSYTIRRTKSLGIASDRLHYFGDILVNGAVIATFVFQSMMAVTWIDPLFALLISAGMCIGAFKIAKMALSVLMDAELPEKDRRTILVLAQEVDGVCGVHDLRTRMDNGRCIIEAHIEMEPYITLKEAHDITEAVAARIETIFPKADILLHQDPVGVDEPRLDSAIEQNQRIKSS